MNVGSLFSGIGGLDLGLERAGMTVVWQSEIDAYCCRVLRKNWPEVPNLGDITTIDWSTVDHVDLICGGYPCQPFSLAGARAGTNDKRHLWPYFADAIRGLRPRFVLLENVPGHLSNGFGDVFRDLAELGFDAEWHSIPAAAVGAPHLRYRVFVLAHTEGFTQWPGLCAGLATAKRWRRLSNSSSEADAWPAEPDVGRVADGVPYRVDRLHALGNAVVPAVAELIGQRLIEAGA